MHPLGRSVSAGEYDDDHVPAGRAEELAKRLEALMVELADSKATARHFKHKAQHLHLLLEASGGPSGQA
jgi:hypothetical protein